MIGRIYSAHLGEGERFYLRILLNHVIGCTSFADVHTLLDCTVCHTFKEAACHRGLDDDEYGLFSSGSVMGYASAIAPSIRYNLLYNEPCNPAILWEKYKYSFSDDFLHRARKSVPCIDDNEHIL